MNDVRLNDTSANEEPKNAKTKAKTKDEQDLEDLIFKENQEVRDSTESQESVERKSDAENSDGKESNRPSLLNRASLTNVIPMDKLKNGANNAGKLLCTSLNKVKEKSAGAYETAKNSSAGNKFSAGLNKAVSAGSETFGKLKETDTYKMSSNFASTQYERTSVAASATLEKARAGASVGLEMAKSNANTLKAKVGGSDKGQ
uniref:AlNc14C36G3204 protein n=1 Tax=Albugo laibachii Nc14 TaxID=890382 RepID=F0W8T0_9STRA|nr:AlNc14C36G3204 [Albugo laibachii Nc14]|eukprot:CCA17539.1 AlNc14C36G3204 [Albugo laibachii Nc14]